ncbi:MAG: hypothetical protein FRX49_04803 [Trebouxia sp. A1-2]|nr:MAG: hypothetical protein FRX49_04803 [Trebouxia sp. A1-2]
MSRYEFSPELVARHQSSCSDDETAESELRANKQVIRDHQLAKYREALLPMAMLEPGLVLQSVPKGHSASAKEVECIRADYDNMKAEHEQRLKELSDRLKSQEATRRRAQKDLLKLREEVASSQSLSTSANQSAEMETASLIQAESELKANKGVIRDSQLAKYREALLSMSILEPGLVLQSVPKGHSASAKEVEYIKEDQNNIKAQYEQEVSELTSQLAVLKIERDDARKQLEASVEIVQALDRPSCDQAHAVVTAQAHKFQDLGGPSATALQAQLEVSEARLATSRWQVTQLNQQVSQLQSQQHAAGARRIDGWGRDVEVKKLIEAAQNEAAATRALAASMPSLAQERSAALTKQLSQLQAQLDHTCNALEQQKQEAVSMKLALEEKVSQEKQQPRQEGKENGGSPDTPPAVLNPSPFLLRSALASSPCSSARSSSSNDRNANERFSASAVARAPPALQPAAELSFTSLVHAPVVTPFPAAGRLPLLLEASVPTPPPVKADEQAETADATASDPQQTSGSTVKSAGRHRSGLLAAVSNLSTTVKSKLTPGANSSGSGKQSSGSSTSSTTPQRFRAHTPEPATATPATARHGSMTSQSSAAQTTASECITSSDNSSDKAVLGAADSSAPQRSPAAKAITAVGRMLRRRPAADNSGGGRSSTVHSSSLSMPVQQKRIAASHGRVPPKAEANAVQIRANAASSAVIGSSTSSGPAAPIDAQGARAQEQHKVDTKRSAGNSANAEGQDEVGRKGMVGSRLFGLRPRVARHAEKAEAQKRADTTAGKAEQAASASQSKPRPKSQQSVSTRAAVAQTQSRSRQPRVTIKDKVSANGQMKAQVPRRFAF